MDSGLDSLGKLSDAALLGRVFKINNPDPNAAAVVGKTSFSNDQPSLALISSVMNLKKKVVSYISLEQKSPVAGGDIEVLVFVDTVNRLTTGGTHNNSIALKNPFLASKYPRDFDFAINPTLNVAGSAGLTLIDRGTFPAMVGSTIEFNCDEDWQFSDGGPGSLLIWIISATTGLSFKHHIEVIQF